MTCNLYRVLPNSRPAQMHGNYLVYRHCFDTELQSSHALFEAAMWHKTAVFVTQSEAEHYCAYRNRLCEQHGSDALPDDPGYKEDHLRDAVVFVVDRFKRDEAAGYRSRDRQFAIEILAKGLEHDRR